MLLHRLQTGTIWAQGPFGIQVHFGTQDHLGPGHLGPGHLGPGHLGPSHLGPGQL